MTLEKHHRPHTVELVVGRQVDVIDDSIDMEGEMTIAPWTPAFR